MTKRFAIFAHIFFVLYIIISSFLFGTIELQAKELVIGAQEFLENFSQTICSINRKTNIAQQEKSVLIRSIIKKNINMDKITKKIMADHYSDLSEGQVNKFKKRYLERISNEYGQIMLNYRGIIKVLSSNQTSEYIFTFNTYSAFTMNKKYKIKYIIVFERELDRYYLHDIIFEDSVSLLEALKYDLNEEIYTEGLDEFINSL